VDGFACGIDEGEIFVTGLGDNLGDPDTN